MYECGTDTTTLSFPTTAVATRKRIKRRHSQNLRKVCADHTQSSNMKIAKQMLASQVNIAAERTKDDMCWKRTVQKCASYGQGIFTCDVLNALSEDVRTLLCAG